MKIQPPLKGVSDVVPDSERQVLTSRYVENMRGEDPRTRKLRISSRAGTERYLDTALPGPVRALRSVTFQRANVTYSDIASGATTPLGTAQVPYSARTESASRVYAVDTDSNGNVYATDGESGVVKYNSTMDLQWKIVLPVKQNKASVRAIRVANVPITGADSEVVFAGVSTGGRQADAALWCYKQISKRDDEGVVTTETEKVFELTTAAFISQIRFRNGVLYTSQNEPESGRAWIRRYTGLTNPSPDLEKEWEVPYPINDFDVRSSDGAVCTAHPQNLTRGIDPKATYYSPRDLAGEWKITDLIDYEKRIWSHYAADALGESLDLVDGDPIDTWPDLGPSFRDLVGDAVDPDNLPFWVKNGIGGKPSVRFPGNSGRLKGGVANTTVNATPLLQSGSNPSTQAQYDDQQRTMIPAYQGAKWAMFIVLRPSSELPFNNTRTSQFYPPVVFSQKGSGAGANAGDLSDTLLANATQVPKQGSAADTVTATEPGGLVLFTATNATNEGGGKQDPEGGGNLPFSGWTGESPGACVVTIIHDGGASGGTDAAQHSTWRVDGRPLDRWVSAQFLGTRQTELGATTRDVSPGGVFPIDASKFVSPWTFLDGDIAEIIVLRDYPTGVDHTGTGNAHGDPVSGNLANNATPPTQHYPRAVGTYGAAAVTYAAAAGNRYNDNEIERIEGMLAGKYGIAHKLPCGTASVLQTTASPAVGDTVTIDGETYTLVNAFTGVLNEVMHPSATTHPSMFDAGVCLLRLMRAINASGTEGVEYSVGQVEHPTVVATSLNAQTNTQVARLKIETKGLSTVNVSDFGANWSWSNATTSTQATVTGADNTFMPGHYPHPFNIHFGYPRPDVGASIGSTRESKGKLLASEEEILARWDPQGRIAWVLTSRLSTATPGGTLPATDQKFGGLGFACKWSLDGDAIYSVGSQYSTSPTGTSEQASVRRVLDTPTAYDVASTGAWSIGTVGMIGNAANTYMLYPGGHVRIDIDKFDNVYVPFDSPPRHVTDNKAVSLVCLDATGAVEFTWTVANSVSDPAGVCVAVDRKQPEYDGSPTTRGYACYLGTRMGYDSGSDDTTQDNIYRIEPVGVSHVVGVPNSETRLCAVADGEMWTSLSGGALAEPSGTGTLLNPVLATDADNPDGFVSMDSLNGHLFVTDGVTYLDYDARKDIVEVMRCRTAGELKPRARLVKAWRGRLIWARFSDDPNEWLMSAVGKPYDYDISPQVITATQAVLGSKSPRGTGKAPDIVNALIPFSDDILIVGCESSIWVLDGDPMDGGRFWLMSNSTGIAFGDSWCQDEYGTVYFMGTRGCVYSYTRGGGVKPLSDNAIPDRLRDIDFSTTYVKMQWDTQEQGFRLFRCPVNPDDSEAQEHYFWSRRMQGWYTDTFKNADHEPTAVFVGDGDLASERRSVVGCVDGYIRAFSMDATSDDGEPILSRALCGPLTPDEVAVETRFKGLTAVLATSQGGCGYQLFASDMPDSLGTAVATGSLEPGRNSTHFVQGVGSYVALELSAQSTEGFSVESLAIGVYPAGRKRPR